MLSTVGVALLCRSLRVHPVLCAWAGFLYVCCGPVASCWTVKFIPTSTLPWLVLGWLDRQTVFGASDAELKEAQ